MKTASSKDPDILNALPALKRAANSARKLAKETGTPVYGMKNGRIANLRAGDRSKRPRASQPISQKRD
jgi:hypothetical protein